MPFNTPETGRNFSARRTEHVSESHNAIRRPQEQLARLERLREQSRFTPLDGRRAAYRTIARYHYEPYGRDALRSPPFRMRLFGDAFLRDQRGLDGRWQTTETRSFSTLRLQAEQDRFAEERRYPDDLIARYNRNRSDYTQIGEGRRNETYRNAAGAMGLTPAEFQEYLHPSSPESAQYYRSRVRQLSNWPAPERDQSPDAIMARYNRNRPEYDLIGEGQRNRTHHIAANAMGMSPAEFEEYLRPGPSESEVRYRMHLLRAGVDPDTYGTGRYAVLPPKRG